MKLEDIRIHSRLRSPVSIMDAFWDDPFAQIIERDDEHEKEDAPGSSVAHRSNDAHRRGKGSRGSRSSKQLACLSCRRKKVKVMSRPVTLGRITQSNDRYV